MADVPRRPQHYTERRRLSNRRDTSIGALSAAEPARAGQNSLELGVANVNVNLITPGSLYGDRVNELDLRFTKLLRISTTRTRLSLDMYNALNAAPVLTYNQIYSPTSTTWLNPTSVLAARVVKLSASVEF